MLRLDPIIVISLDPYATAFCEEVQRRLAHRGEERGRLIKMYALVLEGDSLRFEEDLSSVGDANFDLESASNRADNPTPERARSLFDQVAVKLQRDLIEILSGRHWAGGPEANQPDGVEVTGRQLIYLVLAATDRFAASIIIELTSLIRWLFATRFADDPFGIESVVLLPGLLAHAEQTEYAAAYSLLKVLDHSATECIPVTPTIKTAPFEFIWLIDGRRSPADYLGSLADNLTSYSDAFVGFLTAGTERNSAPMTFKLRGKAQAYSTFGYAELFFPFDVVISRLSATLAGNIIDHAFLAEAVSSPENRRKMLLASKKLVLSSEFSGLVNRLKDHPGASNRHPFNPDLGFREGDARTYESELKRRYDKYKSEEMIDDQNALESVREEVLDGLVKFLDAELDRRADASQSGLHDALELLEVLTDPKLPLQEDIVASPQNFVTEQLLAESVLDEKLQVTADTDKTEALLGKADELRVRLVGLRTTVRMMSLNSKGNGEGKPAPNSTQPLVSSPEDDESQNTLDQIAEIDRQMELVGSEYEKAFKQEREDNFRIRQDAISKTRAELEKKIASAKTRLIDLDNKWREARRLLNELAEERRSFIRRHLYVNTFLAMIFLTLIHLIITITNVNAAGSLFEFYWDNIEAVLGVFFITLFAYGVLVGAKYLNGIHREINAAKDNLDALRRNVRAAAALLRKAYDDEARFEYESYSQRLIADVLVDLIGEAGNKTEELRSTLAMLRQTRERFDEQYQRALPASSRIRYSVINAADIDSYFRKEVTNPGSEADFFVAREVSRSQVRRITGEAFAASLSNFAFRRFERLENVSIGDVLLREPNFIPPETALERLRDLMTASRPLLRIREVDTNRDKLSQRDTTSWVYNDERDDLLRLINKVTHQVTVRHHGDKRAIRMLTRWLSFPAYFLGQIDYFHHCYNRHPAPSSKELPDLIPYELGLSGEARRALEHVLQASALGLIQRREDGRYYLAEGNGVALGLSRQQIAEDFVNNFASRKIYAELSKSLKDASSDHQLLYNKLTDFLDKTPDLESLELETLESLIRRYNPLR